MEERKDIPIDRSYQFFSYMVPKYYDGVISISDFISDFYQDKELIVYKFPPMIDCKKKEYKKDNDYLNIVFPANGLMKDDLDSVIQGIALL